MKKIALIVSCTLAALLTGVLVWWKIPARLPDIPDGAETTNEANVAVYGEDVGTEPTEGAQDPEPAEVLDPTDAPEETEMEMEEEGVAVSITADYPAMIRVNGLLYQDSGEVSDALRCGVMDGQITSSTDGVPNEENQSNFGQDYGYQYWTDSEIHVQIDGEWHVFIPYDTPSYLDWDSLTEEEKMELDPMYGVE